MGLTVAIANDHGGVALKKVLMSAMYTVDIEWIDLGTDSTDSVDYPDFGYKLNDVVVAGDADFGIAICGSGIGISIACNRNIEIRAALCTDVTMARLARAHNNANVLCLGARLIGETLALEIVGEFLTAKFEGGRHERRVQKLGKV